MIKQLLLAILKLYQRLISPLLGSRCRFYPSCSHYAEACLHQYALPKALWKTSGRLLRCQPWHPGGVDLP